MDDEKELVTMLEDELMTELDDISKMETGSDEKRKAIQDFTTLYKSKIEMTRCEEEYQDKYDRRVMEDGHHQAEMILKEKQLHEDVVAREREMESKKEDTDNENKHRYIRYGLEAAGIVLPMAFYAVWMHKGLRFEEKGTLTSPVFRSLWSRFKPTK